jgi:hypothetical protein
LAGRYKYLSPLRALNFTGTPNYSVNILSTINAFPHPRVLGFIIDLFLAHHTTAMIAFCR